MSKHQRLLDLFFRSLFPTIEGNENIRIHILSKNLSLPDDNRVKDHYMSEFRPHAYFNQVIMGLRPFGTGEYVGIVNDDILFSDGWYEDVMDLLKYHYVVSPGFIETRRKALLPLAAEKTKDREGVYKEMVDSFYVFPLFLLNDNILGIFDEDIVEWWDVDFRVKIFKNNIDPVTSKKITVLHLFRQTLTKDQKLKYKDRIRSEMLEKYGSLALKIARNYPKRIRSYFKEDGMWEFKERVGV